VCLSLFRIGRKNAGRKKADGCIFVHRKKNGYKGLCPRKEGGGGGRGELNTPLTRLGGKEGGEGDPAWRVRKEVRGGLQGGGGEGEYFTYTY